MTGVEIRNGRDANAPVAIVYTQASLRLTNVVVRNMAATAYTAAAIWYSGTAVQARGMLQNVLFENCTTSAASATSALKIMNPAPDFLVQNVSFVDCTGTTSAYNYAMQVSATLSTSSINFGGAISFSSTDVHSFPGLLLSTSSSGGVLSVLSTTDNPSSLSFTGYDSAISFDAVIAPIFFQANSLLHNQMSSSSGYYTFNFLTAAYPSSIEIQGTLATYRAAIASVPSSVSGFVSIQAHTLLSDGCLSNNVFQINTATNISVDIMIVTNPKTVFAVQTATLNLSATTDISLSRATPFDSPALRVSSNAKTILSVGRNLIVDGFVGISTSGGAFYASSGVLQISAKTITIQKCKAFGNGGALYLVSGSSASLTASDSILIQRNEAVNGSAISAATGTTLSLFAPTLSISNNIASIGSALYIAASHASVFQRTSFLGNVGSIACVASFQDTCAALSTTGTVLDNFMLDVTPGNSTCPITENLCLARSLPPSVCSTVPPSSGLWTCENGQWLSSGSITTESVTIPASPVVVIGNLTVTGVTTFSGLESSISVEGGCAYIGGTLQVQLTPAELEAIAKQSGGSRTTTLISQSSNCTTNLASLVVSSTKSAKTCRKVTTLTQGADDGAHSSLVVVFKVDSSSCNTRWIILGSVLGGVLLILVIAALIFTFVPKARECIRPYSGRNKLSPASE